MIIKLFDVSNGAVIPSIHCHTIGFLKDIMDNYEDYIKIYSYLQYMTSWNPEDNPYLAMREEDREESILHDLGIDFSLDDDMIQDALTGCRKLTDMPSARIWRALKIGIDQVTDFITNTVPDSGKDGSFNDYIKAMEKVGSLNDNYNKGYKSFMEELKINIRGDKFISQV